MDQQQQQQQQQDFSLFVQQLESLQQKCASMELVIVSLQEENSTLRVEVTRTTKAHNQLQNEYAIFRDEEVVNARKRQRQDGASPSDNQQPRDHANNNNLQLRDAFASVIQEEPRGQEIQQTVKNEVKKFEDFLKTAAETKLEELKPLCREVY